MLVIHIDTTSLTYLFVHNLKRGIVNGMGEKESVSGKDIWVHVVWVCLDIYKQPQTTEIFLHRKSTG